MKKFIDVDGFKLFLHQLVVRLLNIEKTRMTKSVPSIR